MAVCVQGGTCARNIVWGLDGMDMRRNKAIAARLEQCRIGGWLSDYLVAWHGPSGHLAPNVTVWRADGHTDDEVKNYLAELLAGIVPFGDIVVEDA